MAKNFSVAIVYDGKQVHAVVLPVLRRTGMHYEVNVPGHPRFQMKWGPMGRYEVIGEPEGDLPDNLVLAMSDAIEEQDGAGR